MTELNAQQIIQCSRENGSTYPVTTAMYLLAVVMNEDDPTQNNEIQKAEFAEEFQRALDNGYFIALRYDAMQFQVISRTVLDVAPPNAQE
jgi:PP-loop superfamily ATP-utilizing enzyme